jgi:hypothetical protein
MNTSTCACITIPIVLIIFILGRIAIMGVSLWILATNGQNDPSYIPLLATWGTFLAIQLLTGIGSGLYAKGSELANKFINEALAEAWLYMFVASICIRVSSPQGGKDPIFIALMCTSTAGVVIFIILVALGACCGIACCHCLEKRNTKTETMESTNRNNDYKPLSRSEKEIMDQLHV